MKPRRLSEAAAVVIPTRRIPSMKARNSWVISNVSERARSRVISSQRAQRWPMVCSRLHAATIATGCINFILPLERIAPALVALTMVPGASAFFSLPASAHYPQVDRNAAMQ